MFGRKDDLAELRRRLRRQPVVGLLGPRQIGKTTVALELATRIGGTQKRVHLEDLTEQARPGRPPRFGELAFLVTCLLSLCALAALPFSAGRLADLPKHVSRYGTEQC